VSLDAENGIERPLLNPPHPLFKEISIAKAVKSDASASCPLNQAPAQSFPSEFQEIEEHFRRCLPSEHLHHEFGFYPLKLVQGHLQSLTILI